VKWKKPSEALTGLFERHVPDAPGVQVKPMFGCRTAFLKGNMFFGTFQDALVFRVGEEALDAFVAQSKVAEPFRPMPKMVMKGWALVREPDLPKEDVLERWVRQSLDFALTLKPKTTKAKKPKFRAPGARTG
jgi:TfoX/Sxy family transcriptional regulator of competence genes